MILLMQVQFDIGAFIESSDNGSKELNSIIEICYNRISFLRGIADGKAAGSWVFDGNTDRHTYEVWRKGIDDGDPAVLDQIPLPETGGERADEPTWLDIAADIMYVPREVVEMIDTDDMYNAYRNGFDEGVMDEIVRVINVQLADE
jgi:hypothetical protein